MESLSPENSLPLVKIDEDGVFKYVQISYNNKIYLRGRADCKYHKGIYRKFIDEVKALGKTKIKTKCLGGGRIEANSKNKTLFVYGYSNAYGRYEHQHEKSVEMLKVVYPDYKITWSNEGY